MRDGPWSVDVRDALAVGAVGAEFCSVIAEALFVFEGFVSCEGGFAFAL